jgi:hypothetical protein
MMMIEAIINFQMFFEFSNESILHKNRYFSNSLRSWAVPKKASRNRFSTNQKHAGGTTGTIAIVENFTIKMHHTKHEV